MACTIEPLISRNVLTIKEDTTVLEATQHMVCKGAGSVVVTNGAGDVVGFFTERDLLTRVISRNLNPAEVSMGSVMSDKLIKVCLDATCQQCHQLMKANGIRHLLVFQGRQFIGTVSLWSLADQVASQKSLQELVVKAMGGVILVTVLGILAFLVYLIPDMVKIADRFFSNP